MQRYARSGMYAAVAAHIYVCGKRISPTAAYIPPYARSVMYAAVAADIYVCGKRIPPTAAYIPPYARSGMYARSGGVLNNKKVPSSPDGTSEVEGKLLR